MPFPFALCRYAYQFRTGVTPFGSNRFGRHAHPHRRGVEGVTRGGVALCGDVPLVETTTDDAHYERYPSPPPHRLHLCHFLPCHCPCLPPTNVACCARDICYPWHVQHAFLPTHTTHPPPPLPMCLPHTFLTTFLPCCVLVCAAPCALHLPHTPHHLPPHLCISFYAFPCCCILNHLLFGSCVASCMCLCCHTCPCIACMHCITAHYWLFCAVLALPPTPPTHGLVLLLCSSACVCVCIVFFFPLPCFVPYMPLWCMQRLPFCICAIYSYLPCIYLYLFHYFLFTFCMGQDRTGTGWT